MGAPEEYSAAPPRRRAPPGRGAGANKRASLQPAKEGVEDARRSLRGRGNALCGRRHARSREAPCEPGASGRGVWAFEVLFLDHGAGHVGWHNCAAAVRAAPGKECACETETGAACTYYGYDGCLGRVVTISPVGDRVTRAGFDWKAVKPAGPAGGTRPLGGDDGLDGCPEPVGRGDAVTCCLDLAAGTVSFRRNELLLWTGHTGIDTSRPFFPAAWTPGVQPPVLNLGQWAELNPQLRPPRRWLRPRPPVHEASAVSRSLSWLTSACKAAQPNPADPNRPTWPTSEQQAAVQRARPFLSRDLMRHLAFYAGRMVVPGLALSLERDAALPGAAAAQAIHLISLAVEPAGSYAPGANSLRLWTAVLWDLAQRVAHNPCFGRAFAHPLAPPTDRLLGAAAALLRSEPGAAALRAMPTERRWLLVDLLFFVRGLSAADLMREIETACAFKGVVMSSGAARRAVWPELLKRGETVRGTAANAAMRRVTVCAALNAVPCDDFGSKDGCDTTMLQRYVVDFLDHVNAVDDDTAAGSAAADDCFRGRSIRSLFWAMVQLTCMVLQTGWASFAKSIELPLAMLFGAQALGVGSPTLVSSLGPARIGGHRDQLMREQPLAPELKDGGVRVPRPVERPVLHALMETAVAETLATLPAKARAQGTAEAEACGWRGFFKELPPSRLPQAVDLFLKLASDASREELPAESRYGGPARLPCMVRLSQQGIAATQLLDITLVLAGACPPSSLLDALDHASPDNWPQSYTETQSPLRLAEGAFDLWQEPLFPAGHLLLLLGFLGRLFCEVDSLDPRGNSTAHLPESWQAALLKVAPSLVRQCSAQAADGASPAVVHELACIISCLARGLGSKHRRLPMRLQHALLEPLTQAPTHRLLSALLATEQHAAYHMGVGVIRIAAMEPTPGCLRLLTWLLHPAGFGVAAAGAADWPPAQGGGGQKQQAPGAWTALVATDEAAEALCVLMACSVGTALAVEPGLVQAMLVQLQDAADTLTDCLLKWTAAKAAGAAEDAAAFGHWADAGDVLLACNAFLRLLEFAAAHEAGALIAHMRALCAALASMQRAMPLAALLADERLKGHRAAAGSARCEHLLAPMAGLLLNLMSAPVPATDKRWTPLTVAHAPRPLNRPAAAALLRGLAGSGVQWPGGQPCLVSAEPEAGRAGSRLRLAPAPEELQEVRLRQLRALLGALQAAESEASLDISSSALDALEPLPEQLQALSPGFRGGLAQQQQPAGRQPVARTLQFESAAAGKASGKGRAAEQAAAEQAGTDQLLQLLWGGGQQAAGEQSAASGPVAKGAAAKEPVGKTAAEAKGHAAAQAAAAGTAAAEQPLAPTLLSMEHLQALLQTAALEAAMDAVAAVKQASTAAAAAEASAAPVKGSSVAADTAGPAAGGASRQAAVSSDRSAAAGKQQGGKAAARPGWGKPPLAPKRGEKAKARK